MTGHEHHVSTWEIVVILVLLFILVGIYHLVKAVFKQVEKDLIFIIAWRFLTGAHLHGKRVTDATWWSHGATTDRKYDKDGWLSRWEHKPRGHRALWRLGCLAGFAGLIYGLVSDWTVTLNALKSFGVYLVVVIAFLIEARWVLRVHNRHVVNPIVQSLAPVLRMSPHAVRRLFHISPENIKEDGEIGYMELPDGVTPGDDMKETIARIIDAHLPVDSEVEYKLTQSPKLAVIMAAQKPPAMVLWDETLEAMENAAYGEIIIGKDRYKQVYSANFIHLDDPHWAFSVQSKRGKSTFLGLVAVQVLHQDPLARVFCVDPKRSSLIDFLGSPMTGNGLKPLLPGVSMANNPNDPEGMCSTIHDARVILEDRSKIAERDRDKKFSVNLVIIDELNMFTDIVNKWWEQRLAENAQAPKETREILPRECPVWDDIRAILRTGRFVATHMIAVAQDFRDDSIGGKGTRNYFGFRGLGGYKPNQWKYFIGTTPVPVVQKGVGRWIFVDDGEETWVQVVNADPDKAYAFAAKGRELYHAEESVQHMDSGVSSAGSLPQADDRQTTAPIEAEPSERVIIGLREAANHLGMTKVAFERARTRYKEDHETEGLPGEFRTGRQPSWRVSDLDAWKQSRPGSKDD